MSLMEQERALFDLLFNRQLRETFCENRKQALSDYQLTTEELQDFAAIRADALKMDAQMRSNLILANLSKHLPLSFSLYSSLDNGIEQLRDTLNSALMLAKPAERPVLFADMLCHNLKAENFDSDEEYRKALAIIEAERALNFTSAQLKHTVLEGEAPSMPMPEVDQHWAERPIDLAPNVSLAVIPQPYSELKKRFCPKAGSELWKHLQDMPLPAFLRTQVLEEFNPRFMVARAKICEASACDPEIDHFTAELAEGFAGIFQHINGTLSVNELLAQLKHAGANDGLLQSVQNGLLQLFESGFLQLRQH